MMFKRNHRLLIVSLASALLLVLAWGAVSAQDDAESGDLPEPDPAMQQLEWFIGEWDVVSRMLTDAENDEWIEENLRTVHSYELGGNMIFEHFFGPLGGEPFEAWSLRTYNPREERWEQRWVDTSPSGFADWTGNWDEEEQQFVGYANRFRDEEGNITGDVATREVFYNISEDSFSWKFEVTRDGGETWQEQWTLEYTRADTE